MTFVKKTFQKAYHLLETFNEAVDSYRAKCFLFIEDHKYFCYSIISLEGGLAFYNGYYRLGLWAFFLILYLEVRKIPAVKALIEQYREDQATLNHHLSTDYLFYNRCWWLVFLLTLLGMYFVVKDFVSLECMAARAGVVSSYHKDAFYALLLFVIFLVGVKLLLDVHIIYCANPSTVKTSVSTLFNAAKKVAGVVAITHGLVSGMPIELHAGSPVTNLVNMYSPFGSGVGYRDGNDVHKVLLAESCLTSRGFKIEDFLDANGFLDRPKFIAYLKANKDGFQGQGLTHVERLLLGPEFFPQEVAVKSPLGKHCVENDVE